ncbi:MAG: hypothetical protein EPO20_25785 [Betaproteobacteria bacterium]|nr:MAG: hypothetical protein EPO20_25785 [Betaproteobacteria bacterium]
MAYKVLVPFEGSNCALRALEHAVTLAQRIGECSIHIAHAAFLRSTPAAGSACTSPCTAFTSRPARRAASRSVIAPPPAMALSSSQRLAVKTFQSKSADAKEMCAPRRLPESA